MSMLNYMFTEKKEKQKINTEIIRNYSIVDEVTDLALNIVNTREVIVDNLMFDYLILEEESRGLMTLCEKVKVDYNEVDLEIKTRAIKLLRKDVENEKIARMTWNDVSNNLIRINKRLILSKIKKEYPDVYFPILNRAKETADKIIRGINQ